MSKEFRLSGFRGCADLPLTAEGRRASEGGARVVYRKPLQDYFYLHGLSVEMAEALAEYVHKRIRGELGFAAEEARDPDDRKDSSIDNGRRSNQIRCRLAFATACSL